MVVSLFLWCFCRSFDTRLGQYYEYQGGSRPKTSIFYCTFFVWLLCSFICLQTVYQLSGPVCKSTWRYNPLYSASYLHFMLYDWFVVHLKIIIFSAIATDDRHPLRSRSIHQNAANCKTIRFRYIAQPKGVRKTYCARSHNDVQPLTSLSNSMLSKKTMELLEDVCSCRNYSKARPHVSR